MQESCQARIYLVGKWSHLSFKVDPSDYDRLRKYTWYGKPGRQGSVYAMRRNGTNSVYAHQMILPVGLGLMVDHINGDTLDNRRSNLRAVNHQLNSLSQRKQVGTSKFKGVSETRSGRWAARIYKREVPGGLPSYTHLGTFDTEEEAYEAYVKAFKSRALILGDLGGDL